MIHTPLTTLWGLRYPIIGAPMAGVAEAPLAVAISGAGGLGMLGVGSAATPDFIQSQSVAMQMSGHFGVGLMIWALKQRPELLEATLAANPMLVSLSFGDPTPYIPICHRAGVRVAVQVHDRREAQEARAAKADLLVAQGTEAGGHTGSVATLPLVQIVLEEARGTPVVAAGGIATPRAVAGVLTMGAAGAWIGTLFTVATEARQRPEGRIRLLQATENDTVLTHVYDQIQAIPWPEAFAGRALTNAFITEWQGREALMMKSSNASHTFRQRRGDYTIDYLYAGHAIGLVNQERSAADLVRWLGDEAETHLRRRTHSLLSGPTSFE